jgi:hypothetical protein
MQLPSAASRRFNKSKSSSSGGTRRADVSLKRKRQIDERLTVLLSLLLVAEVGEKAARPKPRTTRRARSKAIGARVVEQ